MLSCENFQFDDNWESEKIIINKILINEQHSNGGLFLDSHDNSVIHGINFISTPQSFNLIGNSPNPFNPSTTIQWEQDKSEHIKIDIYDIEGNFIESLTNMQYSQGSHRILWDASAYSSGFSRL